MHSSSSSISNSQGLVFSDHRDVLLTWLEIEQAKGSFDGLPEDDMNFRTLSDNELEFYFYNWFLEDDLSVIDYLLD